MQHLPDHPITERNLPDISHPFSRRSDDWTLFERVTQLETMLVNHLQQEEAFQSRLSITLDELNRELKLLTEAHVSVKGYLRGFAFAAFCVALLFTDTGQKLLGFIHKLAGVTGGN